MKKRLLIATLGESPAVVTEAIDLLSELGECPDSICIIKTKDPEVDESFRLIDKYVPKLRGVKLETTIEIPIYDDIKSKEATDKFIEVSQELLKKYNNKYEYYVCIAGGRKAMSVILSLAVKSHGAKKLFHIWAPDELEKKTQSRDLKKLERYSEKELINLLFPKLDGERRPRIIDIPIAEI
ncbi:MAG TPA: CRISPR-associated ring nuclease [Rectinema sp.]|jgi:CRISPR-associated protein Csx14|nr:CRISPR-associated ring nuclease [Rectinema sp.]